MLGKNQLKEGGCVSAHSLKVGEGMVVGVQDSWPNCPHSQEAERAMVVLTLLRSFYWVQDQSPQLGWAFLLLSLGPISIEWQCPQLAWVFPSQWAQFRNSLIDVPEVCLLSDIRSSLVDSIRYHIWKQATVVLSPSEVMSNEMTTPPHLFKIQLPVHTKPRGFLWGYSEWQPRFFPTLKTPSLFSGGIPRTPSLSYLICVLLRAQEFLLALLQCIFIYL